MDREDSEVELGALDTEAVAEEFSDIDELETRAVLELINDEDRSALEAVRASIPSIEAAVDRAHDRLAGTPDASVVYIGTGTSGRLGAVDAAEWPPTFGVPPSRAGHVIAGGEAALTASIEDAEDDTARARERVRETVSAADVAFGISASGRTPFTVAGLEEAADLGAATVALTCNPETPLTESADVAIVTETGPEVIAGSTRMKAGLATKAVLTMFSTALNVRLGHVSDNVMVDLQAVSGKLRDRAVRIVTRFTDLDEAAAREVLAANDWDTRAVLDRY